MIETNVSDEEVSSDFKNSSFGDRDHRILLEQGVLKNIAGYRSGSTLTAIMIHLGLISKKENVLKKGRMFVFSAFYDNHNTG